MPHYSVFTFSTDWLTNGRLLLTMLPLYYCQTLNVTMMLRFDDILLIFVELYRQPEEKHPLWCSHYVSKNWNKNSGVGPAKKVRVRDPGQFRLHYKGYSQGLPHHSIQVDVLGAYFRHVCSNKFRRFYSRSEREGRHHLTWLIPIVVANSSPTPPLWFLKYTVRTYLVIVARTASIFLRFQMSCLQRLSSCPAE